jgi:hypothetical protein
MIYVYKYTNVLSPEDFKVKDLISIREFCGFVLGDILLLNNNSFSGIALEQGGIDYLLDLFDGDFIHSDPMYLETDSHPDLGLAKKIHEQTVELINLIVEWTESEGIATFPDKSWTGKKERFEDELIRTKFKLSHEFISEFLRVLFILRKRVRVKEISKWFYMEKLPLLLNKRVTLLGDRERLIRETFEDILRGSTYVGNNSKQDGNAVNEKTDPVGSYVKEEATNKPKKKKEASKSPKELFRKEFLHTYFKQKPISVEAIVNREWYKKLLKAHNLQKFGNSTLSGWIKKEKKNRNSD